MRLSLRSSMLALVLFVFSLSAAEKLDGIIAVVGDSVILSSELEAYMFLQINQLGLQPDSLEMNILRYKLLNGLIEGKVLLVRAEKDTNITISNDELESELKNRIKMILNQNRINMQEFEKLLEKEQGITLSKFKKEIRQQIRQEMLKQKVQQFYIASESVSRSDIEKFYYDFKDTLPTYGESILLSKITISLTPSDEVRQKAYAKITSLKEKLDNGEDFAEVAALHSEGPNAASGGDLGYISKGTLSELTFEEKIFSLKPGETSAPFETRLGFHIINVLDRKDQKVHIRQLFVTITPAEKEIQTIMALFDSIKTECKTKECFVRAVKKYSKDEASKARNGRLHWQALAELDSKTKDSFDTLAVGIVGSPVRNENSVSLYRIEDIKESRKLSLSEDWNKISQIAQQFYIQKKLIGLVDRWQKELFIDIRL